MGGIENSKQTVRVTEKMGCKMTVLKKNVTPDNSGGKFACCRELNDVAKVQVAKNERP